MNDVKNDAEDLTAERDRSAALRDPTGVAHLDTILGGGLPRGSLTLVMGLPGSGKTTLASQIAFTAARAGRTALILTALSESTSKLIGHLSAFTFFDQELIGGPVQFLSLQGVLAEGLDAVSNLIISEARRSHAGLVLLDGFRGMRSIDADPQAAREFLYTIGSMLSALGTTIVVTSETDPRDPAFFPETTTADVILGLHYELHGVRQFRG
ncbi:MAG TPA: ATPase domain-containing protein, partial [Ktedonobacterales bacterium]